MSKMKCGCVIADAKNTSSVRNGYEMGGYVKTFCADHARNDEAAMTTAHDSQQQASTAPSPSAEALLQAVNEFCRNGSEAAYLILERAAELSAIAATPQQAAPQHGGLVPQGGSAGGVTDDDVEVGKIAYMAEGMRSMSEKNGFAKAIRAALESFAASRLDAAAPAPCFDIGDDLRGWVADPDSIPKLLIDVCHDAICQEFGENGTDGYYKRILKKVFAALAASPSHGTGAV